MISALADMIVRAPLRNIHEEGGGRIPFRSCLLEGYRS